MHFEEVELSNRSALRLVGRRCVSFWTLFGKYEGSVICSSCHCILRGLFSSFVVFAIPCWPAVGRVTHMTYFKIFAGVLHPHMHCLKVTVLHDTERHAPVMVIWSKRELLDLKWNSYCIRLKMRIFLGWIHTSIAEKQVGGLIYWKRKKKKKRTSGCG